MLAATVYEAEDAAGAGRTPTSSFSSRCGFQSLDALPLVWWESALGCRACLRQCITLRLTESVGSERYQ